MGLRYDVFHLSFERIPGFERIRVHLLVEGENSIVHLEHDGPSS